MGSKGQLASEERRLCIEALVAAKGNRARAARLLEITRHAFGRRLKAHRIGWGPEGVIIETSAEIDNAAVGGEKSAPTRKRKPRADNRKQFERVVVKTRQGITGAIDLLRKIDASLLDMLVEIEDSSGGIP